jgi:hypothetical protein
MAGSGPVAANRAVALLSSLYGWWGQRIGRELPNPCRRPRGQRGPGWNKETPRERYLLPDELRRWWAAVLADVDTDTRELAALLLLLGVRRGNLQRARWEQIDLAARCWRIPAAEMKANREHEAPLSTAACGILATRWERAGKPEAGWVFPGRANGALGDPRGGLGRITKKAGIVTLHPHDLRRSFATLALDLVRRATALPRPPAQPTADSSQFLLPARDCLTEVVCPRSWYVPQVHAGVALVEVIGAGRRRSRKKQRAGGPAHRYSVNNTGRDTYRQRAVASREMLAHASSGAANGW